MHAAPYRTNSDFQWEHFISGTSHTADGKWALLHAQLIGLKMKVNSIPLNRKRRRAHRMRLVRRLKFGWLVPKHTRMMWEADLAEHDVTTFGFDLTETASRQELATVERLMAEVEADRKFSHLPLLEALGKEQEEEWYHEFCFRAENHIAADFYKIPADQIAAFRQHPRSKEIGAHLRLFRDKLMAVENESDPMLALQSMPKLRLVAPEETSKVA